MMFFRIFLIGMISWAIFKLYRLLTGGRRGASSFQRAPRNGRYDGKAVDAQYEEVDDSSGTQGDS